MNPKALRLTRITLSAVCCGMMTGLFASLGMAWPGATAWLARIQIFPAAMGFGMGVFAIWLIVTLLLGRAYCSTVCPLGFFMDCSARAVRIARRRPYHWAPARRRLRNTVLAVTVVTLMAGFATAATLLDPYSAYGRMVAYGLRPVWQWAGAHVLGIPVKAAAWSALGFAVAAATAIAVAWTAARRGRLWCNTICPVGTTLGFVSRYSLMHIDINTDRCIQCRKCEHACKAQCIDLTGHTVDMSRCVVCFDCLGVCPNDAIHYTLSSHRLQLPMMQRTVPAATATPHAAETPRQAMEMSRRRFLAAALAAAAAPAVVSADRAVRKAARATGAAVEPRPALAVYPPGAPDRTLFMQRCTGCGLCTAHCPTAVIRAATGQYGTVRGLLHPVMDYDAAACDYSCTRCNNLCPTGALQPLTLAEKRLTRIGRALTLHPNCVHCGRCARACPRKAIAMRGGLPYVDPPLCIGCGACQAVCPAYPFKAIYVDGLADGD